ncbi:MAG: DUF1499 domain-containing protein [Planctomycetaceae bacterium]
MSSRRQLMWLSVVLASAVLPVVALAVMARLAPRPRNLGRHANGELAPLPGTPNAVSSFSRENESHVRPFEFAGDPVAAWDRLREVVRTHPGLQIISEQPGYLHAEATSQLFRFVDDVEFLLDEATGRIDLRSASRVGRSDLGVNRSRCEALRERFQQATSRISTER